MIFIRSFLALTVVLLSFCAYAQDDADFVRLARSAGAPKIPGLNIVYLAQLGDPAEAPWTNIILHQTEGAPGMARGMAQAQAADPARRGVTIWVETDGTIYWSTPETAITTHGDGANRKDNKYLDNSKTYGQVTRVNSIGVEFNGNAPDVRVPPTPKQFELMPILVRFLQARYGIPPENVYAHNWIDYKDGRYCEGCELARRARAMDYRPPPPAAKAEPSPPQPEPKPSPDVKNPGPATER
jgi:hypothetical protein